MTKHIEQILKAWKETNDQDGEVEQAFSELQDLKDGKVVWAGGTSISGSEALELLRKNFELERVVKECLVFANILQLSSAIKSLDLQDTGFKLESILKNIEDFWNKQSI